MKWISELDLQSKPGSAHSILEIVALDTFRVSALWYLECDSVFHLGPETH